MSFVTPLLAIVIATGGATAAPAHRATLASPESCTAPHQTGIFRVTVMKPDSTNVRPAMLVLENINGCLEATLITDESSPAIIDHLAYAGDTLSGQVKTGSGSAFISLQFDAAGVTGSITKGGSEQHWVVRGRRTA
jgi:hypothetical protein